MVSIDENAQVGIELTTSTMRLTGRAIIAIMDMFLQQDDRKNYYQDLKPKTKQGKQNVKDLFEKYENTEVQALDSNLSREEIKNIEKELKSMGVDFSIRKIEKDNYSLFFAGKDIEAIEKGMDNAIIKRSIKEQRKEQKQRENKTKMIAKKPTKTSDKAQQKIDKTKEIASKPVEKSDKDKIDKTKEIANKPVKKKENETKKKKPVFNINQLQKKHIEKKKEKKQTKVRNKTPNRTI